MGNKKIISNLLSSKTMKRNWKDIYNELPEFGTPVIIRITTDKSVYKETETEIYPVEDIKLARFEPLPNGKPGIWKIEGPFPMIDFSPLSNKENLKDDAYVSHWAIAEKKEIDGWHDMLNHYFYKYNKLRIEVDDDKKETIYRALSKAAFYLSYLSTENQEVLGKGVTKEDITLFYQTLYDMQTSMDREANNIPEHFIDKSSGRRPIIMQRHHIRKLKRISDKISNIEIPELGLNPQAYISYGIEIAIRLLEEKEPEIPFLRDLLRRVNEED